jgi:predicted histidine transporter YuiF (NhaC family)
MKTLIISVVCLLAGLAIGCYGGYRYCDRYQSNEAMQAMVESLESSAAMIAAMNARTISLIDSVQNQQAVQMLSLPIGSYYFIYASSTFTMRSG